MNMMVLNPMGTLEDDIAQVDGYTEKIDGAATDGLAGTANSLAYRVHEIEKHHHSHEFWFGLANSPSGETHRGDLIDASVAPFVLTAGNNAYGNWVQIIGSGDTPIQADYAKFDLHRFLVTTTNDTNIYNIQIANGESAGLAAKITAKDFTSVSYIAATNNNDSGINEMMMPRYSAGDKMWARCICVGQDAKTISVYFGIHEYAG